MNVYVVGHGAVGSYLGERLTASGATVTYAPRELTRVEPVRADLAIVAVKAFATDSAIVTLHAAFDRAQPTVLTAQNGVGNEERFAAAFGADSIVAAALTVPVEMTAAGAVAANARGGIGLAPVGSQAHNWLIAAFEGAGLRVTVARDFRALKWSKLSLNIVANASCAILDMLPAELVRDPALVALEIRAIRETHAVMTALGIGAVDLPRYPVRTLQRVARLPIPLARAILKSRLAGARGSKPPSLLLDLRAGRRETEATALSGVVAAAGRTAGVATPVNTAFTQAIESIATDPTRWIEYRGRPEALIAAVTAQEARSS